MACAKTGVFLHMEIQRGKEAMKKAEFADRMNLKTAACAARLMKYTSNRRDESDDDEDTNRNNGPVTTYLADAWFGSVDAVLAAEQQGVGLVCIVKTASNRYPKKYLKDTMKDCPPGSYLALQTTVQGVDLVALEYKYSRRKVLCFLFQKGYGSIKPGKPYVAKWKNSHNNTISKEIPRPDVVARYFQNSNKIDVHNQSRQHDLRLEKCWVTRCGVCRIVTTIIGICVVDAWKTYRHHLHPRHRHHDLELIDFVSILAKDLLTNKLTRSAPVPSPSYNHSLFGSVVNVPDREEDPFVPRNEPLTQDSIIESHPNENWIVEEVYDRARSLKSVEKGEHGLKKVDKWIIENK